MKPAYSIILDILLQIILLSFCNAAVLGSYDPNESFSVIKPFTFPGNYALIITQESKKHYNTFAFVNPSKSYPRILKALKIEQVGISGNGKVDVPPLFVTEPGILSFHYLTLIKGDSTTSSVVASSYATVNDMLSIDNIPQFQAAGDPMVGLVMGMNYQTHIYTYLVEHNSDSDIVCRWLPFYTGVMKAVYVNDDFQGDMARDSKIPLQEDDNSWGIMENFRLKAHELNFITIIGYRLRLKDQVFTVCRDTAGSLVLPTFSFYYTPNNQLTVAPYPVEDYELSNISGACEIPGARCDFNEKLTCPFPYFRNGYNCTNFSQAYRCFTI